MADREPSELLRQAKPAPRRDARSFEVIPGGKIRSRPDHHTPYRDKQVNPYSRRENKAFVLEGLSDYESQEELPLYDQWEDWTYEGVQVLPEHKAGTENAAHVSNVFYPAEELRAIKADLANSNPTHAADRARIREALTDYRRRLRQQIKGIADIIETLWHTVHINPGISANSLMGIVSEKARELGLTYEQMQLFKNAALGYEARHEAVNEYASAYASNPSAFFNRCFEQEPVGAVEIEQGPMTVLIRCYNDEDYVQAYNYPITQGDSSVLEQEDKTHALKSGGVALFLVGIPGLQGTIIIERVSSTRDFPGSRASLEAHEKQHQFNKLFTPLERKLVLRDVLQRAIEGAKDQDEVVSNVIHEYVRFKRRELGIDKRARDEIISYYTGGTNADDIYTILSEDSLYDYQKQYAEAIAQIPDELRSDLEWLYDDLGRKGSILKYDVPTPQAVSGEEVTKHIYQVFDLEYKRDLRKWMDAIKQLEKKGYRSVTIIGMLFSHAAAQWTTIARRAKSR